MSEVKQPSIKILDSNLSKTNKISSDQLFNIFDQTLDIINETLLSSYGKYSLNSLIVYDGINSVPVFTTDGIHKLKSLEFISPIQTYLSDNIRYIGECIEKFARDGTTTGMLFTSLNLKYLLKFLEQLDKIIESLLNVQSDKDFLFKYIRHKLANYYNKYMDYFLDFINSNVLYLQDTSDDIHFDDFRQDVLSIIIDLTARDYKDVLKQPILELIQHIPDIFYEYFSYYKSSVETDTLIDIYIPDYQYSTKIVLQHGQHLFNENAKTEFKMKNVDLLILPYTIYTNDYNSQQLLLDTIENLDDDKYLVILSKHIDTRFLSDITSKYPNKKLIFAQYVNYHKEILESGIELEGLVFGNKVREPLVKDVDIHIQRGEIFINNIFKIQSYKNTKAKINIWSLEENDNKLFLKWKKELETLIDELKHDKKQAYIDDLIKEYINIYKRIVIPHFPVIKIGGKVLEHLEMIDILEDVLGSISIILKHGILTEPYFHMSRKVEETIKMFKDKKLQSINNIHQLLTKSHLKELLEISDNNYLIIHSEFINKLNKILEYGINLILEYTFRKLINYTFANMIESKSSTMYINYKTVEQLLIRSKDVVPKFLKTSEVIVPGTVSMSDKKK